MNSNKIKIEQNIPIPPKAKTGIASKWPFRLLNINESFTLTSKGASSLTSVYNKKLAPKKFVIRKISLNTFRIWRIK